MLLKLRLLAKSLLAVAWIRWLFEAGNRILFEVFGASRILAHLFYSVFPLPFNREQAAVLQGRRNYYRRKNTERRSRVELRRNIHRLEKGLVMVPRRPVFAADYIGETIEFYRTAAEQFASSPRTADDGEMRWAHDVLAAYFDACDQSNPAVESARETFSGLPWSGAETEFIPTLKRERGSSTINLDQMRELAMQRRSTRSFDEKPVSRLSIDQALEIAAQAPTACNRMPYEYRIFDEPDLVREIAQIPFGTVGYSEQIPALAVVVGKLDDYFSPRDRHAFYIDASLSAMSFLFALETQGLSSCIINWPDFEPLERKMQKKLGLELTERVVMLIAIGHARDDALVPYSKKKQLESFRSYNRVA